MHGFDIRSETCEPTGHNEALAKATGKYGRTTAEDGAVKSIDPRKA